MTRIAVGITATDGADARRTLRHPGRTVADAVARGHVVHGDHLGGQRHGRAQPQLGGTAFGEGRSPVEHDAGAKPVHMRRRQGQHGGGVGEAALIEGEPLHAVAALQLMIGERVQVLIGTGEVAHQVDLRHLRRAAQALCPALQLGRLETQPVHPRIQLEPDIQRPYRRAVQQPLRLHGTLHRDIQPQRHGRRIVLGIETAFEQQQTGFWRLFAHHARLLDAAYGETVGLLAQRRRHRCRTVAIGIGLGHRESPASRCATLGQGIVVTNGGQVDRGNEGTHRAGSCAV